LPWVRKPGCGWVQKWTKEGPSLPSELRNFPSGTADGRHPLGSLRLFAEDGEFLMRITVRLSGEVAARLEALKRASGKTTTAIVREALRDKLLFADVREKGQPTGSLPAPEAPPRAVASAMVSDGPPGGQEAPQKLPDLPEELRGQVASLRAYGAAALDEARSRLKAAAVLLWVAARHSESRLPRELYLHLLELLRGHRVLR
jgi:hypothetical protein